MIFAPNNKILKELSLDEQKVHLGQARCLLNNHLKTNHEFDLVQLSASEKSRVYRLHQDENDFIAKFYSRDEDFDLEIKAYTILKGSRIPKLIEFNREGCFLVAELIQGRHFKPYFDSTEALTKIISQAHRQAKANLSYYFERAPQNPDDRRVSFNLPKNCFSEKFLEGCRLIWGEKHLPVSIGDLKPEHILVEKAGMRIVDLETLRIGRPEIHDLLCISNFFDNFEEFIDEWEKKLVHIYAKYSNLPINTRLYLDLLHEYLDVTTQREPNWP